MLTGEATDRKKAFFGLLKIMRIERQFRNATFDARLRLPQPVPYTHLTLPTKSLV